MKSHSRHFIILLLTLGILLLGGGYYMIINMLWAKAASVAVYKNDIVSADQKKEFAKNMLNSFALVQDDISLLQTFFVEQQGEVDFIEYLEQTVQSQGLEVSIDTVSVDAPKNIATYGMEYLVLQFNIRGTWSRVWNFSRMIEVLPYSVKIQSFALIREGDTVENTNQLGIWKGVYTIKVLKKK